MNIIDWNPAAGDLCQGDVVIFRIPDDVPVDTAEEIAPRDNRLILAEGEITGHHHAIWNPQPALFRDDSLARELEAKRDLADAKTALADFDANGGTTLEALKEELRIGTARLYRDPAAVQRLVELGDLTHERLAIGLLVVEGGPVVLRHDEHDAVRIPVGRFYVGGQSEWDAAQERRVSD